MFNLTRQEKLVLLFFALVVLSGITISYLKKKDAGFKEFLTFNSQQNLITAININTATADELIGLPGIGPELAARIIEYRKSREDFKALDDIKKVKGIGSQKYELIKSHIRIE